MKRKTIAVLVLLVALIAGMTAWYVISRPETDEGAKTITVVVSAIDYEKTHTFNTDQEFLLGALNEENMIVGEESVYGVFVTSVDGIAANADKQEWWCITKGGEAVMTGVSDTPIYDGDSFELTLMIGY